MAVMATHEEPELERAHLVLPAALWAEYDGTFTNYQRRVQRFQRAFAAAGRGAAALGAGGRRCCSAWAPRAAASARELFALLAAAVPDYAGLDLQARSAPRAAPWRRPRPRGGER